MALEKEELVAFILNLENIRDLSNEDMKDIYECNINFSFEPIDGVPSEEWVFNQSILIFIVPLLFASLFVYL